MITIPKNISTTDWPASVTWFSEEGILYSVYKKGAERSLEETKATIEAFKKIVKNKKVCILVDVTHSSESSREIRNYAAEELPKFTKAIAMVSDSAVGKMLANLFLTLKTQPYPTKMFSSEVQAKNWLMQFL